jgi:hypothetical protein|nr:MAG TPA: Minor structural protein 4, Minor, Lactococcus lactis, Siphoviridae, nanobody [Caudoviricetes sp.]
MEDNKSFEELEKDFTAIRDENRKCANTAFRIGSALLSLLALSKKTLLQNKEFSEGVTFLKGIVAKAVSYFQGIVNRGDIKNTGDITNTGNIHNTGDITNSGNIMTKNLTVTGKATFFELEIQKAKATGGMTVNSAGFFHVDAVVETVDGFVCYQRAEKDGVKLLQTCEVSDQMMCSNGMNILDSGKGNRYYWRKVTKAPKEVVTHTIDGKEEKCLKLVLSKTDHSDNTTDIPQVGDDLVQIGNRDKKKRQSVIVISAYNSFDGDLKAPYWVQYDGVNDYKLSTHKRTWFAANGSQVTGNFKVQSDNGGLESIEDYVRGLATNTVVYKMSISPSLYYINSDGTAAAQVVNISAYKIQGDKMTQLQDSDDVQVYVSIGVSGKWGNGSLTGSGGSWRYFPNAKDGMEERILELYVGGKMVDQQVVNAVKDGEKGKDAITYKLIPLSENALAYFTENKENKNEKENKNKKEKKVDIKLLYRVMKSAGEQVNFTTLEAEGMTLTIQPSVNKSETLNYDYDIDAYRLSASIGYREIPDNSYTVTLTKGSDIVDQRIVPITFKPNVVFNIDTELGKVSSDISTVDGKVNLFEQDIEKTKATVGKLDEQYSQLEIKSNEISLTVNNGTRPNLLWGSDLDLSEVQDVIKKAYELGNSIKEKTEEKAEWKRKRDNAGSDDDRMRYQDGMDVCDREIAQAQGELAKRREAIEKHLGVVISGDMEIGNREMFQYLKGEGVGGSDAIRFKNVYKQEDWAKWTNISWHDVSLKPNTQYTISVWVKFKSYGKKGRMYVDCTSDDGRYCFGGYLYKEHYYDRADIDKWQRVRYVFDSGASKKMSALNFCCIADEEEGAQCELWLCRPKLEEGNTATPWCAYDGTVEALLESGLDIKNRKMIATADNFVVQNNKGEKTFMVDKNGKINNGMLSLDGLDAKRAVIKRLRFQSNSVAPYFVTEESMKEFAAYCTRYYAGYGANPLLPFDVAMFFVFLIKPKWLTNIDQGYNRDFSPRSRDIAVSKGMARGFQVDYFSFALELFWHNMVGKTVTIANATNENISFGVKLKTEVLDDMGKKVTQIGGRLDNLPNFPERCVERINLLPGQIASFKYTLFSGAPMNVLVREVHTKGFFLLQDLFDFSYYKKLFEVGYDTEQGFNIFDKKYIDLFNTDKEHVEPKGGFPKKKR